MAKSTIEQLLKIKAIYPDTVFTGEDLKTWNSFKEAQLAEAREAVKQEKKPVRTVKKKVKQTAEPVETGDIEVGIFEPEAVETNETYEATGEEA